MPPEALHHDHLDWALVIATKDRPEALEVCVALALTQTRPPSEGVVVDDSSKNWQDHAARTGRVMADHPGSGSNTCKPRSRS